MANSTSFQNYFRTPKKKKTNKSTSSTKSKKTKISGVVYAKHKDSWDGRFTQTDMPEYNRKRDKYLKPYKKKDKEILPPHYTINALPPMQKKTPKSKISSRRSSTPIHSFHVPTINKKRPSTSEKKKPRVNSQKVSFIRPSTREIGRRSSESSIFSPSQQHHFSKSADFHATGGSILQPPIAKDSPYITQASHLSFGELKDSLMTLWKEMKVDEKQQTYFEVNCFQVPNHENLKMLRKEYNRLVTQRQIILELMKSITQREELLSRIHRLVKEYDRHGSPNTQLLISQTTKLISSLKLQTVNCVEQIYRWKSKLLIKKPFIYNNEDYLHKMHGDMEFFYQSELSQLMRNMGILLEDTVPPNISMQQQYQIMEEEDKRGKLNFETFSDTMPMGITSPVHDEAIPDDESVISAIAPIDSKIFTVVSPNKSSSQTSLTTPQKEKRVLTIDSDEEVSKINKKKKKKTRSKSTRKRPSSQMSGRSNKKKTPKRPGSSMLPPLTPKSSSKKKRKTRKTPLKLSHVVNESSEELMKEHQIERNVIRELERIGFVDSETSNLFTEPSLLSARSTTSDQDAFNNQLEKLEKQEDAALRIQLAYRQYRAKLVFYQYWQDNQKLNASIVIQCAWRSHKAKSSLHLLKLTKHALSVQKCIRQYLARTDCENRLIEYTTHIFNIQKVIRMRFVRNQFIGYLSHMTEAANVIKGNWLVHRAKCHLYDLKIEKQDHDRLTLNSTLVQSLYRGNVQKHTTQYNIESVVMVQSHMRRFIEILYTRHLRGFAIPFIEIMFKQRLMSQQARETYEKMKKIRMAAATEIQRVYRGYRGRKMAVPLKELRSQKQKMSSVIVIQSYLRMYLAMKPRYNAISSQVKRMIEIEQLNAALIAQKVVRVMFAKNQTRKEIREYKRIRTITGIQSIIRTCLKERETYIILNERKQKHARFIIQNVARVYLSKLSVAEEEMKQNEEKSALLVQRLVRRLLARRETQGRYLVQKKKKEREAQKEIEKTMQRKIARQHLTEKWSVEYDHSIAEKYSTQVAERLQEERAALKIQCAVRCMIARSSVVPLRDRAKALDFNATQIQRVFRGYSIRKNVIPKRKFEVEMERKYRSKIARAAIVVQSCIRAVLARNETNRRQNEWFDFYNNAVKRIQAYWRGRNVRIALEHRRINHYDEIFHRINRDNAAYKFQRLYRTYKERLYHENRKMEEYELEIKSAAAKLLQNAYRIYAAKKIAKRLQQYKENQINEYVKQDAAAYVIQRAYKAYRLRNVIYKRYRHRIETAAAMVIQYAARSLLSRVRVKKAKEDAKYQKRINIMQDRAAVVIQQNVKCWLARRKYMALKAEPYEKAARVIQKWYRKAYHIKTYGDLVARQQWKNRQEYLAACKIQNFVRSANARYYGRTVVLVQSKIRQYLNIQLVRRRKAECVVDYVDLLMSPTKTPASPEHSSSSPASSSIREEAAIDIQRIARSYLTRKKLRKEGRTTDDEAAKLIQCAWRRKRAFMLVNYLKQNAKRLVQEQALNEQSIIFVQSVIRSHHQRYNLLDVISEIRGYTNDARDL